MAQTYGTPARGGGYSSGRPDDVVVGARLKIGRRKPDPPSPTRVNGQGGGSPYVINEYGYWQVAETSPERKAEMVERYRAGESVRHIARMMAAGAETVRDAIVAAGMEIRGPGNFAPVTEERKAEMVRRYQAGQSIADICRSMSSSSHTVRDALDDAGVARRPGVEYRHPDAERRHARIVELYKDGMPVKEIVETVGTSRNTVYVALRKANIERRRKKGSQS